MAELLHAYKFLVEPWEMKIKLAASLIGTSSIHLIKSFVDIANENPEHIKSKIFAT